MNIKDFFGKSLFAASLLSACLLGNNAFAKNLPLEGHVLDVGLSPIPPFVIINGEFSDLGSNRVCWKTWNLYEPLGEVR